MVACLPCRRAKNKCIPLDGNACSRCAASGLECTYETANKSDATQLSRRQVLESKVDELQAGQRELKQLIDGLYQLVRSSTTPSVHGHGVTHARPSTEEPTLPGFESPWLAFGNYGLLHRSNSTARHEESPDSSDEDATNDFDAPNLIIDTLVHDADAVPQSQDAREGHRVRSEQYARTAFDMGLTCGPTEASMANPKRSRGEEASRVDTRKKRRKADTPPRKPFSDIITKGYITSEEGKDLWDTFFAGCHWFVPLWDIAYDQFETFRERSPFGTNSILAVAARIQAKGGPLNKAFYSALHDAQGIARSTLFGPVVRKEVVLAMLVLSIWSRSGWLPCGHALRMAMEMNLHQALARLTASEGVDSNSERDMVVSARIWLNVYLFDNRFSIDNGKPLSFRDDNLVQDPQALLRHPLAAETDVRLVASVELIKIRIGIVDQLNLARAGSFMMASCRRLLADLSQWYAAWQMEHLARFTEDHVLLALLELDYSSAQLWTVCVALKGCKWRDLKPSAREMAFMGKEAAQKCLQVFATSNNLIRHLRYATREPLVASCFAAVFLLRMAVIYPDSFDLAELSQRVEEAARILTTECCADRFALALRVVLSEFRKRTHSIMPVQQLSSDDHAIINDTLFQTGTDVLLPAQDDVLAMLGLDMSINWEQLGDPHSDPGFTWQTSSSLSHGNVLSGSLQPDAVQEPFQSWGLSMPPASNIDTGDPSQWFYDLPDTADGRGEAW